MRQRGGRSGPFQGSYGEGGGGAAAGRRRHAAAHRRAGCDRANAFSLSEYVRRTRRSGEAALPWAGHARGRTYSGAHLQHLLCALLVEELGLLRGLEGVELTGVLHF